MGDRSKVVQLRWTDVVNYLGQHLHDHAKGCHPAVYLGSAAYASIAHHLYHGDDGEDLTVAGLVGKMRFWGTPLHEDTRLTPENVVVLCTHEGSPCVVAWGELV